MTDKELKKLSKSDLLEILYYIQKENEELRAEIEKLKASKSPENIVTKADLKWAVDEVKSLISSQKKMQRK